MKEMQVCLIRGFFAVVKETNVIPIILVLYRMQDMNALFHILLDSVSLRVPRYSSSAQFLLLSDNVKYIVTIGIFLRLPYIREDGSSKRIPLSNVMPDFFKQPGSIFGPWTHMFV